jgi:redox-sensitive bicupin YhaK (pirin superfamily)
VQVMSAGTGVKHSEFNQTKTNELNCWQIWVKPKNVEPRYQQITLIQKNEIILQQILSQM